METAHVQHVHVGQDDAQQAAVRDDSHASVGFYTLIAFLLVAVTAVEVGILYPPLNAMPDWLRVIVLVILSVAKFATVVAFFMHLYFDHPLTTGLFLMGMILAIGTVVGLIHIMPGPHEPRLQPLPKKPSEPGIKVPATEGVQSRLELWRRQLNA